MRVCVCVFKLNKLYTLIMCRVLFTSCTSVKLGMLGKIHSKEYIGFHSMESITKSKLCKGRNWSPGGRYRRKNVATFATREKRHGVVDRRGYF